MPLDTMVPGRIKFDPDFYPDAPWVPLDVAEQYLATVQANTPLGETGDLFNSLAIEQRGQMAWVSSDRDYGGIILEWGSELIPASRILSTAAAIVTKSSKLDVKAIEEAGPKDAAVDEIFRELQDEIAIVLRSETRKAIKGLRGLSRLEGELSFLKGLRGTVNRAFRVSSSADPDALRALKLPFRATETDFGFKPPSALISKVEGLEPLRGLDGLSRVLIEG